MRKTLGLEQPERGIGLSAHDFAMLAAGPCVLLTRALKVGRRAHHRLALAAAPGATDTRVWGWTADAGAAAATGPRWRAQMMEVPPGAAPAAARAHAAGGGASAPPVGDGNRDLAARSLCHLCQACAEAAAAGCAGRSRSVRWNAAPPCTGRWNCSSPISATRLPDDAVAQLVAIADEVFAEAGIPKAALALWRPRFLRRGARASSQWSASAAPAIATSHLEITAASFRLGRLHPDRRRRPHRYAEGRRRRDPGLQDRRAAQQPAGDRSCWRRNCRWKPPCWRRMAFGIGARIAEELIYLSLAGEKQARNPRPSSRMRRSWPPRRWRSWRARIAWFDEPDTAYRSRVRALSRRQSPAIMTIWRGCANGRRPAGARSHDARSPP